MNRNDLALNIFILFAFSILAVMGLLFMQSCGDDDDDDSIDSFDCDKAADWLDECLWDTNPTMIREGYLIACNRGERTSMCQFDCAKQAKIDNDCRPIDYCACGDE